MNVTIRIGFLPWGVRYLTPRMYNSVSKFAKEFCRAPPFPSNIDAAKLKAKEKLNMEKRNERTHPHYSLFATVSNDKHENLKYNKSLERDEWKQSSENDDEQERVIEEQWKKERTTCTLMKSKQTVQSNQLLSNQKHVMIGPLIILSNMRKEVVKSRTEEMKLMQKNFWSSRRILKLLQKSYWFYLM